MYPKAILLDMDDTIIAFDHGVDLNMCWKKACCRHLPYLDDTRIEEVINSIQEKAKWFWSDPDRHRLGRLDLDKARTEIVTSALHNLNHLHDPHLSERIAIDYGIVRDQAITIFPDAIETLTHLKSIGTKLALITNGSSLTQRGKIERFNLAPYFNCIIIEGEFGVGKPDRSVYLYALKQLGVEIDETWMIGDNFDWEVVAPQSLGIKGIWINHKGVEPPASVIPYKTIVTLSDIMGLLK